MVIHGFFFLFINIKALKKWRLATVFYCRPLWQSTHRINCDNCISFPMLAHSGWHLSPLFHPPLVFITSVRKAVVIKVVVSCSSCCPSQSEVTCFVAFTFHSLHLHTGDSNRTLWNAKTSLSWMLAVTCWSVVDTVHTGCHTIQATWGTVTSQQPWGNPYSSVLATRFGVTAWEMCSVSDGSHMHTVFCGWQLPMEGNFSL